MKDGVILADLFGVACTLPSGRRGRPSHRWTLEAENRVRLALALGYKQPAVAASIGVSVPTLRKHYFRALKEAAVQGDRFEIWRAHVLADQANAGNVGALKELGRIKERRERFLADQRLRDQQQADVEEPLGKKEQANARARQLIEDDGWGGDLKPGWH